MAGHEIVSLLESGMRDAQGGGRALKQGNMDMGFLREVRAPCAPARPGLQCGMMSRGGPPTFRATGPRPS